ncbi:MAG: HigA family addiction module antitoxin [Dehalococcoidia bacterium]
MSSVLREDVISNLGLTVTEAARRLGVTRKTLSALISCKASLSPEMAVRIGKATKTSPESWLYMQAKLDLWNAETHPHAALLKGRRIWANPLALC